MIATEYIDLWNELQIDVPRLTGMLQGASKRHQDVFLSQQNRPTSMAYFDEFWGGFQTKRIKELNVIKKEGKPLVGTFCIFVPEEMVVGAGGACYGLCSGSPASIPEAEKELPRNICPLIKSAHGFKLLKSCGYTQSATFIYGETTCEAKKKTWEILDKHHPVHIMHIPQKKDEKSLRLWREEVMDFKSHIEEVTGNTLNKEALLSGIEIINNKRKALQRLDKLRANKHIPISGRDALFVMQISFIDEPVRFTHELNKLCDELEQRVNDEINVFDDGAVRLIILGTPFAAPNWKLHEIVETSGGAIINEESCIGHRYYKDNIQVDDTMSDTQIIDKMVDRYTKIDCACFTPNEARIDKIKQMVQDKQADGVIYYTLSFCHTYNVESFLVKKALSDDNIPFLAIESDYSPEDAGQIKTRVEAFIESIKFGKE